MNSEEIGLKSDYWLLCLKQMKDAGVITSHQCGGLTRKVKGWWYDEMQKLEGEEQQ